MGILFLCPLFSPINLLRLISGSGGEFSAFCWESSLWPDFGWGPADERRVSKIFPLIPSKARFSVHHIHFCSFSLGFLGLFLDFSSQHCQGKTLLSLTNRSLFLFSLFLTFFSPLSRVGRTPHLYSSQFFYFSPSPPHSSLKPDGSGT